MIVSASTLPHSVLRSGDSIEAVSIEAHYNRAYGVNQQGEQDGHVVYSAPIEVDDDLRGTDSVFGTMFCLMDCNGHQRPFFVFSLTHPPLHRIKAILRF
jgi:hypothetical protein